MRLNLKKFYFVFVLPFFFLMIFLFIIQKTGVQIIIYESSRIISFVFLILSVLFAFVVPLWYRLTFLKNWQDKEIELNRKEFLNFEDKYEDYKFFKNKNELINKIENISLDGDIYIFKGSRSMQIEKIYENILRRI